MIKKSTILSVVMLLCLSGVYGSECPAEVSSALKLLEVHVPRSPREFRIALISVPKDFQAHALPNARDFEALAGFHLIINPATDPEGWAKIFAKLRNEEWQLAPEGLEGDTRWCLRVNGAWNYSVLDIYFDVDKNLIRVGDRWYALRKADFKNYTTDLVIKTLCSLGLESSK